MDMITEALLKEFSGEFGIADLPEEDRFERLAAWLTVRRHYSETTFDPSDLVTGKGNDTGIDAISVIINNNIITDVDSIEDLLEVNGYLDVAFVFVQAERSAHFDMAKIGQFGFGASDFFGAGKLPRNEMIQQYADIMTTVYSRSSKFRPTNPSCYLYYVTTGKWNNDAALVARADAEIASLKNTGQFETVEFHPIGADQIQKLYRQTKNAISREFVFDKRVVVPAINGVTEAYLGFLKASDFLKLVCDDDGTIIQSLFYENVRAWIGYNTINKEIRATLSDDSKDRFILMNNGITMVARMLKPTGDKFLIGDFQVVNGCQTSNVLHDNRELLTDAVTVPFRLIGTTDEAVFESIIRATNRQTEVRDDQFFAMKDYAKKLEAYFKAFPVDQRIYYERRPHQYDSLDIEKIRIITHQNLVRSVGAMFLGDPHITTRTFRALTAKVGTDMFIDTDKFEPYYVSGFALYRLEQLFKNKKVGARYKPARYQALLIARFLMDAQPLPRLEANEMTRRCLPMMAILQDEGKAEMLFIRAIRKIDNLFGTEWTRDSIRTEPVTIKIFEEFGQRYRRALPR